jgi:cell division protein FtsQ
MDRSAAGRGAIGRLDRPLAPAIGLRARPSRRRARTPQWQLPRPLATSAERARGILGPLWSRRRLRLAIVVLAVLAVLGAAAWMWLRQSSLASVQRVQITGVHGPQAGEIDAALSGAARHMNTLDVRLGALRAAVAPFPVVREVKATPSFPHGLRIQVVEQLPVATLAALGTRTAVAADGVALGPGLVSGSLPTLSSSALPAPGQRVSDESLRAALTVIGAAPAPVARLVARAESAKQGLTLVLRNGLSVYFGDSSRPHAKWLALALVVANGRSAGASYVDVRVPERAVAGFAPGTAPPPGSGEGSQSAQTTAEAGGGQESITQALAAGLAKAVGQEQASAPAAQSAGSSEWWKEKEGSSETRRGTGAPAESGNGARPEGGTSSSAEASPGSATGGH